MSSAPVDDDGTIAQTLSGETIASKPCAWSRPRTIEASTADRVRKTTSGSIMPAPPSPPTAGCAPSIVSTISVMSSCGSAVATWASTSRTMRSRRPSEPSPPCSSTSTRSRSSLNRSPSAFMASLSPSV